MKKTQIINDESFSSYKARKFFSKQSIGLILLCSFTELISNIRYNNYYFNYNMKKSLEKIKCPIEFISFFPFFLINERYILKSEIFRHQILGLGISSLCTLIALIKIKEFSVSIFLAIIIIIEYKFLETFHYIIPKKLNTEYFININLICALKGLFGLIISLILFIIFYIFYNYENYTISESLTKDNLLLYFIYIINSCVLNFFIFKIIEKIRPSYYLIPCLLSKLIPLINSVIDPEYSSDENFIDMIIFYIKIIFSVPGLIYIFISLIFCEVLIFKCCNLDKFTKNEITKRAKDEAILDAMLHDVN